MVRQRQRAGRRIWRGCRRRSVRRSDRQLAHHAPLRPAPWLRRVSLQVHDRGRPHRLVPADTHQYPDAQWTERRFRHRVLIGAHVARLQTKERFMTAKLVTMICAATCLGAAGVHALQQQAPKAYVLVQVDVTNPQQYSEYAKLSPGIIEKFGGRFLARGGRSVTLEGPPAAARVVVIEFPSFERAQQFYDSPEYVAARKVRAGAATAQFVLVEGS